MRHHPQGPSRQKNFAICCGFQPTNTDHENKRLGHICHSVWDTGNRQLADQLPDPDFALELVDGISGKWDDVEKEFQREFGPITVSKNEAFLEVPDLNFGTTDRLRLASNAALLGDGKFGAWKVDHAETNLQGHNYAVLVWALFSEVDHLWVWFGNPRLNDYTLAKFRRSPHYTRFRDGLMKRLAKAADPDPYDFVFNEVNCGFCSRLACPSRNRMAKVAKEYIEYYEGEMNNTELSELKKVTNSLKTLTKLVDDEVKTRVLDGGETIEGYSAEERVRSRELIGLESIDRLKCELYILGLDGVNQKLDEIISLPWSDVEQLIVHFSGGHRQAKPLITKLMESLEESKALTTNKYYVITTNKS